jgi:hypothetical protein
VDAMTTMPRRQGKPVIRSYLAHFLGKGMDSKTMTATAPFNHLQAFFILVV